MKYLAIIFSAFILTACGSTLKITKPQENGYYQTKTKVAPESILVSEKVDLAKYKSMYFAKVDYENDKKYLDFYKSSIENINYFDKVLTQTDMEQMILSKGLADKVTSVSDNIGLYHAQKNLGDFLIGELNTQHKGGYDYEAQLKVIDPSNGKVLFHVQNKARNWDGLDQPLFLPVFNAFIDWLKANS
ncbi:hypothetical protein AB835_10110 [Candidatus Endobugula sertula]|uniref:DUF4136 domain-containing protein n=1 Tax=Candidatus Endobugula sertula TaxID=62101 RepID=A0A1D2QNN2_9GAMM|nr:hypothetical protein AB835_10110 [Candidatus Endobugula sertula]